MRNFLTFNCSKASLVMLPDKKVEGLSSAFHCRTQVAGYINNKLLWARKYARIVVRGYYRFREANSCPRAKLEGNCELRETDNVQGKLFVHISEAKSSLLSLLSFKYFLSQRISSGTKRNKTQRKTRRLFGAGLALLSEQFSQVSLSVN